MSAKRNSTVPTPCEVIAYQKAGVCVPVTVKPQVATGTITTICCGKPEIKKGSPCSGSVAECSFTITQSICVKIPLTFGADATVGQPGIDCSEPSLTDLCADCQPNE